MNGDACRPVSICKQTNRALTSTYLRDEKITWNCKILGHQSIFAADMHLTFKGDLFHHSNSPTFKVWVGDDFFTYSEEVCNLEKGSTHI